MFGKKLYSLVPEAALDNPEADYKTAVRLGQYRLSDKAIYKADGGYVPFASVKEHICDQTSVHVAGCCAGGVFVERITFITESTKIQMIFDTKKQTEAVLQRMGKI